MTTATATSTINTTAKPADVSTDMFQTTLTINFGDGRALAIDYTTLDPEIIRMATLHGLKQKLGDAAAIARNKDTGGSATVADKYTAVEEIYNRLVKGKLWNKGRTVAIAETAGSLLVRALMKMTGKSILEINAFIASKSKEECAQLALNPAVAAVIAELKASKVDPTIDTDAMLSGLMG